MITREIKNSKHLNKKVLCIIDDDPAKIGTYLQGIPVVGKKEEIPQYAQRFKIEEIIIAIQYEPTHSERTAGDLSEDKL